MGKAARLFNGTAEQTLYGRVTPTPEQRQFLQEQWNALADHLKDRLSNWGYPISTWIQGSYKYGTLIKPVHKGEEYDVDVGIYFSWDPNETVLSPTPQQLRSWVQNELLEYQKEVDVLVEVADPPKERCSRAIYKQQFHIDTPTYHLNPANDARRLACLSGSWESSDPKLLYKWFRDVVGTDNHELLRRLIRYLKGWAAVAFADAPKARPSSILLTVTVAEAFSNMWSARLLGVADDDALIAVIGILYERFANDSKVPNPVDGKENLNRIPEDSWSAFLTRLAVLNDAAQAADAAEDEASAAFAWEGAFSFLMPLPEADGVEVVEPVTNLALMQVPDIEVRVYDERDGKLLATHMNEVPSAAKDRWLVFDLVNKHVLPDYADISWTVRNDGEEAVHIGDLGHFRRGINMLTVEENTAYLGKHYMDCVIRLNGTIFAVRRVPVNIKPDQKILLAQAQRSWTTLRTRKGRRR
jgi:Adenylyl/Guanylyl and SMODS C-terminal sensor domain